MSNAAKNVIPPNANISIYEIIDECSLSVDEEYEYKEFMKNLSLIFMHTFSSKAAHLEMKVKAFKIGSGECNNFAVLGSFNL